MVTIPLPLNSFQSFLIDRYKDGPRHVLVLGVQNLSFARALKKSLHQDARVCVGSSHGAESDDFALVSSDPWDLDAWRKEAADYGAFDLILLLDTHSWWHGRIDRFAELVELIEPEEGVLWVQYFNALCLDILQKRLKAGSPGGFNLGFPIHNIPMMDLGSWLGIAPRLSLWPSAYWGLGNPQVFEFFQGKKKSVRIPFGGKEYLVRESTDALSLGAFIHGIEFTRLHQNKHPVKPGIFMSPMTSQGLQAFLYPDPAKDEAPLQRFAAKTEIQAAKNGKEKELPSTWADMMRLFEQEGSVKKVLLIGAQWGADYFLLRKHYPKLEWAAVESDTATLEMGLEAFPEMKDAVHPWQPGQKLPFEDKTFDLIVTVGYCSRNHPQIAALLVPEILRVSRRFVAHFEDALGPDRSLLNKFVPLPEIYRKFGVNAIPQGMTEGDKQSGYYVLAIDLQKSEDEGELPAEKSDQEEGES